VYILYSSNTYSALNSSDDTSKNQLTKNQIQIQYSTDACEIE